MSTLLLTGAGTSGSAAFSPTSITGLVLWLKADALALTDGTAVSSWTDSSGTSHNATQATGAAQPIYKTSILNGMPVVRFDGLASCMATAAIDLTATNGVSALVVATNSSTSTVRMLLESSANFNTNAGSFGLVSDSGKFNIINNGNVGKNIFDSTAATYWITAKYNTAVFDMSLSTHEAQPWSNGSVPAGAWSTDSNNTGNFGNYVLNIGSRNGASLFWPGDIAEILVYSQALSTSDRQAVEGYLKSKYGL